LSQFDQDDVRTDAFEDLQTVPLTAELQQPNVERFRRATKVHVGFCFRPKDLQILASRTALINDACLNGSAILLQEYCQSKHAGRCAILSTYDLVRIRYNCDDTNLWRHVENSSYWLKNIWILPIHRPQDVHWVLAIIHVHKHEIHIFDSFAEKRGWKKDLQDIMRLVERMVLIANHHGKALHVTTEGWIARPVCLRGLQTNNYDCGLWVLSCIAAVLRGSHVTGLRQADMTWFRQFIYRLVLAQPPSI
jgi:Ulp1 family protease